MLVGQAPGSREEAEGIPFCGPAGKRLMGWMAEVGFTPEALRRHVYMTAVTRCYPGRSSTGRGDRRPSPAEIARCAPFLDQELAILRPRLLILVGVLAMERLLFPSFGRLPLDRVVGKVFQPEGLPLLVPLPHPSGASTWFHRAVNREKLACALALLRSRIVAEWLAPLGAPHPERS